MAEDANKWVDAVTKLTKLTHEGKIEWSTAPLGGVLIGDDSQQLESCFVGNHKGKKLRIYKKRFKVEDPNPMLSLMTIEPFRRKYPYWAAQIYLEIVDDYGNAAWTFPEVSALRDLFTAVKYQASGVKDLLDDLLREDEAGE